MSSDDEDEYEKIEKKRQKLLKKMNRENDNIKSGSLKSLFRLPFCAISYGNSRGGKTSKMSSIIQDKRYALL